MALPPTLMGFLKSNARYRQTMARIAVKQAKAASDLVMSGKPLKYLVSVVCPPTEADGKGSSLEEAFGKMFAAARSSMEEDIRVGFMTKKSLYDCEEDYGWKWQVECLLPGGPISIPEQYWPEEAKAKLLMPFLGEEIKDESKG